MLSTQKHLIYSLVVVLLCCAQQISRAQTQTPSIAPAETAADCDSATQFFCAFQCMEYTDTVSPQACQDKAVASGGPNPEGSVVCRNGMKIWNGQDMGPGFSLGCLTTTNDPTLMATYGPENTIHTPKPTMASPTIVTENTNSDATTPTDAARGSTSSWNRIALLGLTVILGAFML